MRGVIGTMLVAGLLSAIALAFATPAKGFIYWANGSSIGRANNDGSGPNPNFITGQAEPCGLAVDSQHIYWANQAGGSLGRGNLDGTGINPNFIATDALPCGVALDGTHVWWANQLVPGGANTGSVALANLDGSNPHVMFQAPQVDGPRGVGVGSDLVFWSNRNASPPSIGRAGVDGTPPPDDDFFTLPAGSAPAWPTVGGGRVYFATTIGLTSIPVEGGTGLGSGIDAYGGIAIFGGKVYFANFTEGTVGRANLDMSSPEFAFMTGLGTPSGLAVEGGIPSNEFSFSVKGKRLLVGVKFPGTVAVAESGMTRGASAAAKKRRRLLNPSSASGGPPTIEVRLALNKGAKRKLRQKGKVKVNARITFTPAGGVAKTQTARLTIKGKRTKK